VKRLIDLNYYYHSGISDPREVLAIHQPANGYVSFIKDKLKIELVKHMNYAGELFEGEIKYSFFKSKNQFSFIPFKTHRYIKKQNPDFVLIQALIFPLQLIVLRFQLGKSVTIIVQHHGERPFKGIKKIFQKLADRFIEMYLFTSFGNAEEWISAGIIRQREKCCELLEASTDFHSLEKDYCKQKLQLTGNQIFIWVGRLNANKDPITVLTAFEKYILQNPLASLIMIFQTEELLPDIQKKLEGNTLLKSRVILKGKIEHSELEYWFNAADFYVSGSHKEGSGYALIEAMACGCIPVVTSIPSFVKITSEGKFGFLYEPGNAESLLNVLSRSDKIDKEKFSSAIVDHFKKSLSYEAIADKLLQHIEKLSAEKMHYRTGSLLNRVGHHRRVLKIWNP
jgi:glycosyltransferase involved in cell wall biosynthesis